MLLPRREGGEVAGIDVEMTMQAKNIPDESVIELVRACAEARCNGDESWGWHGGRPGYDADASKPAKGHWANRWDIAKALNLPDKIVLAKLRKLVNRGLITGCACGCRGDFELPTSN